MALSLSCVVSEIFNVEKFRDLEIGVKTSLKVIESGIIQFFLLVFYRNFVPTRTVFEIFAFSNTVTLKSGSKVTQGHHSIERI